jgi:hypothetical protein
MQDAESGRKRVCAYACSRRLCVFHLRPLRLLRISHSWRFGEGVRGRGTTARNRMQGNARLDRRRKPEGLRAEASGSAEHWRSEVDYGFIYRDCEVVMNAHNVVRFWINCPLSTLTHQNPRADRSAGGHCSYLPTTRQQRKHVPGVVAPMNAPPHYFEAKK